MSIVKVWNATHSIAKLVVKVPITIYKSIVWVVGGTKNAIEQDVKGMSPEYKNKYMKAASKKMMS